MRLMNNPTARSESVDEGTLDLNVLGRLVRQEEIRIDILTRGADYTLQYALTVRGEMPHGVPTQLKSVLSKIPA